MQTQVLFEPTEAKVIALQIAKNEQLKEACHRKFRASSFRLPEMPHSVMKTVKKSI